MDISDRTVAGVEFYNCATSTEHDLLPKEEIDENAESYHKTRAVIKEMMLEAIILEIPHRLQVNKWILPIKRC